ncbi:uncharacterized protein METZ01_LOCUS210873, partial [marine metagenome]
MSKGPLVVLGAGPGGYSAAFYAVDLGYEVTLVDENDQLGGVCLHRGCIPSKALLHVSELIKKIRQAKEWGVDYGNPDIDLKRLKEWKEGVVSKISTGLDLLCKQRGVSYISGRGTFTDSNTIQ